MPSPDTPADAWQTAQDIRAGRVTSVEVVTRSLARIHELQPALNAFTVVLDDSALASARDADEAVRRGGPLPALHGVPVSVKDHIWMADAPATNGSLILRDFVPPADAVPVARLRAAGAVIVGKTNNPEFCYRGFTDNLLFGLTRNPWDLQRTPGGSSGGAGSSVAAGMTAIALGTDGGGSIRIPASFCGVVGHKPTFGLVPKEPGFRGWKTLSVDGPLARSVCDAALMLSVIAGPAAADDMSYPGPPPGTYLDAVAHPRDMHGLRVAWSEDLGMLPVDPDVRAVFAEAVQVLAELGCELAEAAAADRASHRVVEHDRPGRGLFVGGPASVIVARADVTGDRRDRRSRARHHRWPIRRCTARQSSLHPSVGGVLRAARPPGDPGHATDRLPGRAADAGADPGTVRRSVLRRLVHHLPPG